MRTPVLLSAIMIVLVVISAVSTGHGWISDPKQQDTCTIAGVHPNVKGDDRLAEHFVTVLKPWLQSVAR